MNSNRQGIVYLLHGLLQTAHGQFAPHLRKWKQDLTVVPVDLPGHGRCPIDARLPYIATALQYVTAVIRRFGSGHLVAASYLGAPVAVRCTLDCPDLVRSLVLTGFVPDVPAEIFAAWIDGFNVLAAENKELARWYDKMHGSRWPHTLAAYTEEVRHSYAHQVCVTSEMLGRVQRPTLIVNGSQKSNERAVAADAIRLGPAIRGQVIEGAGHDPGHDRPEEFDAIVRAFWIAAKGGPSVPTRNELLAELHSALQESDPNRPLDSIEHVAVQALLSRRGLNYPDNVPFPETIHEWLEWAIRFSAGS